MNLTEIGSTIRDHIEQGEAWFGKVLDEHLPALLATAQRYENSPIVQALEGIVLPPEVEQSIATMIGKLAAMYPPAAAQPAPVATGEPVMGLPGTAPGPDEPAPGATGPVPGAGDVSAAGAPPAEAVPAGAAAAAS